jgi:hypothetical protein
VYKQVSGKEGIPLLLTKVKTDGPTALFQGALATSLATVVSCHCILLMFICTSIITSLVWQSSKFALPICALRVRAVLMRYVSIALFLCVLCVPCTPRLATIHGKCTTQCTSTVISEILNLWTFIEACVHCAFKPMKGVSCWSWYMPLNNVKLMLYALHRYATYNVLSEAVPAAPEGDELLRLVRAALIGVCSSCVSDCCSNSIRVSY